MLRLHRRHLNLAVQPPLMLTPPCPCVKISFFVSLHNVSLFQKLMFKFKLTKFHQNNDSIGDGSLIQVMKDLWILGEGSAWVHSPQPCE